MAKDTIKRLAASILKVGQSRVWFDPSASKRISEALTRDDVRKLIEEGLIKKLPKKGVLKFHLKKKKSQKKKGRRRGPGSKKGTKKNRMDQKKLWIAKVRAQRKLLIGLKKAGKLLFTPSLTFKKIYRKIKAGHFKSKRSLLLFFKENNLLKEDIKGGQ
jgi:large subunit ribosomal protein L19e